MKSHSGKVASDICKRFPKSPYIGTYYGTEPALLIQDPDLIKHVLTTDFYHFNSREIAKYTTKEVTTMNMFFTYGERWKLVRQNTTSLFTLGKTKNMYPLIAESANVFEKLLDRETKVSKVLEVREIGARYTIDVIISCIFGVNADTMSGCKADTEKNPFRVLGDMLFAVSPIRGMKNIARSIWPAIFYGLGQKMFSEDIEISFRDILENVFKERQYKPSTRNDFADLILTLMNEKYIVADSLKKLEREAGEKIRMERDNDLLIAQCSTFFAAGFETSATTFSMTLFELAKNKEAQEKAITEVDEYLRRHNNKLDYELVNELLYLDACISETLRLYPILPLITREVVEDCVLPTGLQLNSGMRVHLPIYHIHRDPKHFSDPEEFRPERFCSETKEDIAPYTYLPFGAGPRICMGIRIAKMQILTGLVTLLKKYRISLAEGMATSIEIEPKILVFQPVGGIRLKFEPREGWEERMF
uniref:unspecific monooxygenase n=1 Tax=Carposina sasakii TaxID=252295 RepID=A0A411AG09_CARSA|nr:cytochrome P450 CYP6B5-like protein [Carposina sasakii]